ncbi:MAG: winged helix-turn-helix transcriptional regulator, partial [Lentisphaeria bacterium]|nr:winged helix-turn-helix transcriptional regulator [Lentisphaeria bacterium]
MIKTATLTKPRSGSKLAQFITHAVETGELKPGDKLCTETELAQKYSESVYAVRSALKELKAAGILYSVPKKGVFVCDKNAAEIVEKDNNSSEHNVIFSSRSFLPRQKDIYDKIAESFAETSLVSRMEA